MMATSRSGRASSIAWSETAPCNGLVHERAYTIRSGSPAEAITRPSASQIATCPVWTASTRPPLTTRTSGTALNGSAQDERRVLPIPALQLVLEDVQRTDD